MNLPRTLPGWVLFVVGLVGIAVSWALTGMVAAVIGLASVVVIAIGVVLIGTQGRRQDSASGEPD